MTTGGSPTAAPTPTATAAPPTATPPESFRYTVEEGDTLGDIAARFGVTVDSIVEDNNLSDPTSIAVGQVLIIRGSSFVPTPGPTPTTEPENPIDVSLQFPIAGGCLPTGDQLMPNAPREYRAGIHEGVDFYTGYNCVDVPAGANVLAAGAGTVIRADHDYVPLTLEELDELLTRSVNQGYTDAEALDRFRGQQVWVDHGGGVVTRYCHLAGIPGDITVGTSVSSGDVVGLVGDSGTPESVTAPGVEIHLHFEVRTGDSFLGAGLPPDQVRYLYEQVFSGN